MDVTPPRAFADDDEVAYGKTPEPHRRRVEELERRGELLCREKGSLVRKLDAETKRFDATLKVTMAESDDMRVLLIKTQKKLERSKAEGQAMREEMEMFAVLAQQKALLAMAQQELQVVELEHRLVQAEQQRVIRDHNIVLGEARESDLQAEVDDRDGQLADLKAALQQANTTARSQLASSSHSASAELKKALAENQVLVNQVAELVGIPALLKAKEKELVKAIQEKTKLSGHIEKLEGSVETWKGKVGEVQAELESAKGADKDKEGNSDNEIRTLKAQLRSVKSDLDTKDGECVDLQEELASLKERSKEKEKELKSKLKASNEELEHAKLIQNEAGSQKVSSKPPKASQREASASVAPEDHRGARKKTASPAKASKSVKEKVRKASAAEPESEAEMIPKKNKRTHDSPPKPKKLSKLAPESDEENRDSDAPTPKVIRKTPSIPKFPITAPLGESSMMNKLVKSATMSALSKRKSPAPEKGPMITVTPADEDMPAAPEEVAEKGQGEKKKKRKLLGTKAAFKWDPILESGSGVIPSTFSPMKPGTTGTIPRVGFPHSASMRSLSRI